MVMRQLAGTSSLALLLVAVAASACVEVEPQANTGGVLVEIKIRSEPIRADEGVHYELRVTNTLDRPVRFLGGLAAASLPFAVDSRGKEHRLICFIEKLDCQDVSEVDSVLLGPGAFYGQELYARGLDLSPGEYQFGVSVALQSCPAWTYAYTENAEVRVPIVVDSSGGK